MKHPCYSCVENVSRLFFSIFHRISITGVENIPSERCILASNHASYYDPLAIGSHIPGPICYLARKSLWDTPLLAWWLNHLNCLPVDQERPDMAGLKRMINAINEGNRVLIFPEGTRTTTGHLQPAQAGMGLVVAKTGAPVVPMRLFGSFEAYPKGGKPKLFVPMHLVIHPPIYFDDLSSSRENYLRISEKIMAEIAAISADE